MLPYLASAARLAVCGFASSCIVIVLMLCAVVLCGESIADMGGLVVSWTAGAAMTATVCGLLFAALTREDAQ